MAPLRAAVSFHRRHYLTAQMVVESVHVPANKSGMGGRNDKPSSSRRRNKCQEMPAIPEPAMEFLSRPWNPSSTDIFQCLGVLAEDHHEVGEITEDEELDKVPFNVAASQLINQVQTWHVLASEETSSNLHRHKWLDVRELRAILRGFFLDSISFTRSKSRRRDELRLHMAQAQAAVSVAQLAAAIAGVVSACEPPSGMLGGEFLASAAAMVATVCAEAAESAGAHRPRVATAVQSGLESRSTAELLTLTAAAATCLRGAAALKLRAADVKRNNTGLSGGEKVSAMAARIQKGSALMVCLPCGKVRERTVAVFPGHGGGGTVALRLGKKQLLGAFTTYQDQKVLAVLPPDGDADGRHCLAVAMRTSAGTVQLLLEDQAHCDVWSDAIQGMLYSSMQSSNSSLHA